MLASRLWGVTSGSMANLCILSRFPALWIMPVLADRQTGRKTDRQAERQTGRKTDRQAVRQPTQWNRNTRSSVAAMDTLLETLCCSHSVCLVHVCMYVCGFILEGLRRVTILRKIFSCVFLLLLTLWFFFSPLPQIICQKQRWTFLSKQSLGFCKWNFFVLT